MRPETLNSLSDADELAGGHKYLSAILLNIGNISRTVMDKLHVSSFLFQVLSQLSLDRGFTICSILSVILINEHLQSFQLSPPAENVLGVSSTSCSCVSLPVSSIQCSISSLFALSALALEQKKSE